MANFTCEGTEYRIRDGAVQKRAVGERRWQPCSRASLLSFAVDSPLWDWLREHGIKRPSPSGYVSEDALSTVQVKLRLPKPDAERLDDLATSRATTKSALVSGWIRSAK